MFHVEHCAEIVPRGTMFRLSLSLWEKGEGAMDVPRGTLALTNSRLSWCFATKSCETSPSLVVEKRFPETDWFDFVWPFARPDVAKKQRRRAIMLFFRNINLAASCMPHYNSSDLSLWPGMGCTNSVVFSPAPIMVWYAVCSISLHPGSQVGP